MIRLIFVVFFSLSYYSFSLPLLFNLVATAVVFILQLYCFVLWDVPNWSAAAHAISFHFFFAVCMSLHENNVIFPFFIYIYFYDVILLTISLMHLNLKSFFLLYRRTVHIQQFHPEKTAQTSLYTIISVGSTEYDYYRSRNQHYDGTTTTTIPSTCSNNNNSNNKNPTCLLGTPYTTYGW